MRTTLHKTKLRAVATFARFCVQNPDLLDDKLIPQTLGIAVRKLHDFGECSLGAGKYLGHPYWSRKARALLRKNAGVVDGIKLHLSHEHVVPVHIVVKELLKLPPKSNIDEFENVLSKISLVAIITREEDAELRKVQLSTAPNKQWFETDPWWRYREAKLLRNILDATGERVTPNPSLKGSTNGGPPGPVWWYAVHFHQPGPGVPPSAPP